jgi:hypothetical protein
MNLAQIACASLCLLAAACTGSSEKTDELTFPNAGNEQTPPTTGDATAVQAWLDAQHYLSWQCETEPHAPRGPSMHGMNRACSNDLVSAFTGKTGDERPAGSAAVKEFWDAGKIIGRAAYVKTAAKSAQGDAWYWIASLEGMGVVANGLPAQDMVAKNVCVACHSTAGSAAATSTSGHSGDFVFTQVDQ